MRQERRVSQQRRIDKGARAEATDFGHGQSPRTAANASSANNSSISAELIPNVYQSRSHHFADA
jgi:hypothetical protein